MQPGFPVATTCAPVRGDVFHFAFQQRHAHFRLSDVVNSRRTAAPCRFGQFHQFHTRDRAEKFARLLRNLLPVHEMTRLVVGHANVL